jgi:hypothetical protein
MHHHFFPPLNKIFSLIKLSISPHPLLYSRVTLKKPLIYPAPNTNSISKLSFNLLNPKPIYPSSHSYYSYSNHPPYHHPTNLSIHPLHSLNLLYSNLLYKDASRLKYPLHKYKITPPRK